MFGKILRGSIIIGNVMAIVWLLLCLVASYYDTSDSASYISLFSFTCIFAVLANLFFVFVWFLTNRRWRSLWSLVIIILCWRVVQPSIGLNVFNNKIDDNISGGLKIMSWNVHLFDLGYWTRDNTTTARILKLISDENPDILCMQEYFRDARNEKEPYTDLIMKSGFGYNSFSLVDTWYKTYMTSNADENDVVEVGTMIFSKYPIKTIKQYPRKDNGALFHVVDVTLDNGKVFTLITLHLTSVQFGEKENEYIDDIKKQGIAKEEDTQKGKHIAYKLKTASSKRAMVANAVRDIIDKQPNPTIVTGDFNDMPGSYVYTKIKGDMQDAFIAKGLGLGRTYQKIFPTLRIDNIFYDKNAFKAEGVKILDIDLSDHKPVITYLSLK